MPPDRRREKAAALISASMVAGVVLWLLGGWALERLTAEPQTVVPVQTPGYVAGRVPPSVLHGPGGTLAIPQPTRAVIHVWLQGCSDCMPAFAAMAQLESEGGLNVAAPIINVAYGEADVAWARQYGVATNLVFDPGGVKLVKPLGIGTFTTLVVDPDGTIIHRDRPDRPGYAARVRSAAMYGSPVAMRTDPSGPGDEGPASGIAEPRALDTAAVERVISAHRSEIKRICWDRRERKSGRAGTSTTITLTVGTDGRVLNTSSSGDDPVISRCIESEAHMWTFPRPLTPTVLNIPFKFVQE